MDVPSPKSDGLESLSLTPQDETEIIALPEYTGDLLTSPENRGNYLPGRGVRMISVINHLVVRCIMSALYMMIYPNLQTLTIIYGTTIILITSLMTAMPVFYVVRELIIRESSLNELTRKRVLEQKRSEAAIKLQKKTTPVPIIPIHEYDSENEDGEDSITFAHDVFVADGEYQASGFDIEKHQKKTMKDLSVEEKKTKNVDPKNAELHPLPSKLSIFPFKNISSSVFLYVPVAFEILCLQLYILTTILFIVDSSRRRDYYFLWSSSIPFFTSLLVLVFKAFTPILSIVHAVYITNKVLWYNDYGIVLSRVCLEQYERNINKDIKNEIHILLSEDCSWECVKRPPCISFDDLQSVHSATSIETFSHMPYHQQWVYFKTTTHERERRIIIPVTTNSDPEEDRRWTIKRLFNLAFETPILEGLNVDEVTDLLMNCLAQKRKDLFVMLGRLNASVVSFK
ncbi:hypothetical protein AKO1_013944 [Acrasis kona]|uniref:Uncharacterized protein n=1 Tax=Acrasis kona TaxID=1008807 RepID=A0AAW2Z536_9EUKA